MSWMSFIKAVLRREHRLAGTTVFMAVLTVIYTISPVDFIPEIFLGPLGLADDIGVWAVLFALAAREKSRWEVEVAQDQPIHAERIR